mgnify:CR=1 FL=1
MSKPILTRAQRRAVREHGTSGLVISKTDARKLRRHGMTDIEGQLTPAGREDHMKNYNPPRQMLRALGWLRQDRSSTHGRPQKHFERWLEPRENDWSPRKYMNFRGACARAQICHETGIPLRAKPGAKQTKAHG